MRYHLWLPLAVLLAISAVAHAQGRQRETHSSVARDRVRVSMMGFSAAEEKAALKLMQRMRPAEKAAFVKRCEQCMTDPHRAAPGKSVAKNARLHMLSGLAPAQQETMKGLMMRLPGKDLALLMRMALNCCRYGIKHRG